MAKSVSQVDGVLSADVNFASGVMLVEYDPMTDPREAAVALVKRSGHGVTAIDEHGPRSAQFRLLGLDCPDCASKVQGRIAALPGVESASLDFPTARMDVAYDPAVTDPSSLAQAITQAGYPVEAVASAGAVAVAPPSWWDVHRHDVTAAVSGALIVLAWVLERVSGGEGMLAAASVACYGGAIVAGGWITLRRAAASVRARSLDMNVLMTAAVIGAVLIGEWSEGATVIFLFAVGGLLEARSLARTRRSIRELMDLTPARARVRRGEHESDVSPAEVVLGDLLIVKPGERLPLDGRVVRGTSAVDEAPITGESVPAEKNPGDHVYAGTLNTSGLLEVSVTSLAGDSTLARVVHMVEEAQASRAPAQTLVDRFTRYYTPAVIGLAVVVAVVPPALGSVLPPGTLPFSTSWTEWFYRALVMLVVSCPCALVISTPVAIVSAVTRATRDGVLVKGGAYLEAAPRVRVVAFDKTGTLTCGRPEVSEVVSYDGLGEDGVLRLAAVLEAGSTHPIAQAILRAEGGVPRVSGLEDFVDMAGRGVRARVEGVGYTLGSTALAEERGQLAETVAGDVRRLEAAGNTVLVLSAEDGPLGLIGVADRVRPQSRSIVRSLVAAGVEHVVMLTGDNERVAAAVAAEAGLSEYRARLLPEDKVAAVEELRARYGPVAMVGDGVNDAPALAAADIGIAMGAAGSDTALETADVALMRDDVAALPGFFRLGRRTVANIVQNVVVSVVVKLAVLALAITGTATLWMAVFADTGVSLLVIVNGLRLLRRRDGLVAATGEPCE